MEACEGNHGSWRLRRQGWNSKDSTAWIGVDFMGLSARRDENVWQCVIRNFDGRRGEALSPYRGKRAESVTTADGEEPATMAAPEPSTLTADTHEYSLPF